jgi:hypothetical protein
VPPDSQLPRQSSRVKAALALWGIVEVLGDYRGARIEQKTLITVRGEDGCATQAEVTQEKRRHSFTAQCLDCGSAPHVSPDDASIAVCLRCGRDRWL